jgi:hypothetical protein
MQQNSFNSGSNNLGNPDNSALEEKSPKTVSFAFYQEKSFISDRGISQGHVQKGPQSACTSNTVVSADPFLLLHHPLKL